MNVKSNNLAPMPANDLVVELDRLIRAELLTILFQPIFSAASGTILGWEALSRGPAESALHAPTILFEVAAKAERLVELEFIVLKLALTRFKELDLPGQLFLNLTADSMIFSSQRHQEISAQLHSVALPATRIVIELTETRAGSDQTLLENGLTGLRSLGFVMAIDDLGEGYASLKRWAKMRPDYVKIDRHFVDGVHNDPVKQQFVRSIVEMAKGLGCAVIGEGVEDQADLQQLRQQGVDLIQGFLMARPSQFPQITSRASLSEVFNNSQVHLAASKGDEVLRGSAIRARNLATASTTVTAATTCGSAIKMFSSNPHLYALPVLNTDRRVMGILRSNDVLRRGSENFFSEVYGRRSCTEFMDVNPLIFDVSATMRTMSELVANLNDRHLVDGYIVTEEGRYFGSGKMTELLKAVSDMQIITARYANPLTLLPGNVPIDEHINECLSEQSLFAAAYFDLDYFKAYNDVYGYQAGDVVIQIAAKILSQTIDPEVDFLGHIGGDDFVVIFKSLDWERKTQKILSDFTAAVQDVFHPEHLAEGGFVTQNRQGLDIFHPLVSLSAGIVIVDAGSFDSPAELSQQLAETKKMAKKMVGSSYFVDRRSSGMKLKLV